MGRALSAEVRQVQITTADMGGHWIAWCGFDCATGRDRLSAVRVLCHMAEMELIGEVENIARQLVLFDFGLPDERGASRVYERGGDSATGDADCAGTGSGRES